MGLQQGQSLALRPQDVGKRETTHDFRHWTQILWRWLTVEIVSCEGARMWRRDEEVVCESGGRSVSESSPSGQ